MIQMNTLLVNKSNDYRRNVIHETNHIPDESGIATHFQTIV